VKFVQFSDVHLDASLRDSKLSLPEEKRQQRQREIRQLVAEACSLARERGCDLILVPGDLFDDESADFDTIHFLIDTFRSVSPLPIFITPGNHDPYLAQSPYNTDFLVEKGIPPWPDNVHIFSTGAFQTVRLPGREDTAVTGIANVGRGIEQKRILSEAFPTAPDAFNILLFHGSREPFPPAKEPTMPFNDRELLSQGFDYAAVGHYHTYSEIKDRDGRIRAAYSGTPASQRLNEAGEKYFLFGEISDDKALTLERVKLDRRTLHVVEVNCSGLTHSEAVIRKIEEDARKASQNSDDILFVKLEGRFPRGSALQLPQDLLADKYFHVAIDASGLMPDYDLEEYRREPGLMTSVEGEFVKALLNREAQTPDEREKRIIRAALLYGLDAFHYERIVRRYED
jgi:DNA repair exonuclease SbcCD nuclease subunit